MASGVHAAALALAVAACGSSETSLGGTPFDASTGTVGAAGKSGGAGVGGSDEDIGTSGTGGSAEEAGVDAGPDATKDAPGDVEPPGCLVPDPGTLVTGPEGPSCGGGLDCGGVSCCRSTLVPGGTFMLGRSESGEDAFPGGMSADQPEHSAGVDEFYLDAFEVTVGRFRKFVSAYDGTPPAAGAGANPRIPNSGWQSAWNSQLPASSDALAARLACDQSSASWTNMAGEKERRPLNCISWYEAVAFCIWDGGRLPTEAEWEKAAAGADQNRLYPWGNAAPEPCYAVYGGARLHANVGELPAGQGRFGQFDLAGNLWELTLDFYSASFYASASCVNCANLTQTNWRVSRGGAWSTLLVEDRLRSAFRTNHTPQTRGNNVGFRCARSN